MNLRSIYIVEKVSLIFFFVFISYESEGQQSPLNPVSCWVFTPSVYNPAIIGSKDFLSVNMNIAFQGKSNSEIFSGSSRLSDVRSGYFVSPDKIEFRNIGFGWSLFRDIKSLSKNIGASVSGSYHIPLDNQKLSFLSFGASVKGVYNMLDSGSTEATSHLKKTIYPNFDAGIYFFGTNLFAGFSVTDLLGNPENPDSLGTYAIPVSRKYFFNAGYKFLINRAHKIVLEPSVFIFANDSTLQNITENIKPIMKLYIENFCIGTYLSGNNKTSFFFQYRYPRFNIGALYELPEKTPYYKNSPIIEFTFGINFQIIKSRYYVPSVW